MSGLLHALIGRLWVRMFCCYRLLGRVDLAYLLASEEVHCGRLIQDAHKLAYFPDLAHMILTCWYNAVVFGTSVAACLACRFIIFCVGNLSHTICSRLSWQSSKFINGCERGRGQQTLWLGEDRCPKVTVGTANKSMKEWAGHKVYIVKNSLQHSTGFYTRPLGGPGPMTRVVQGKSIRWC